jgi:hypothetical protein
VVNGTLTALFFLHRDPGRAKIADVSGMPGIGGPTCLGSKRVAINAVWLRKCQDKNPCATGPRGGNQGINCNCERS